MKRDQTRMTVMKNNQVKRMMKNMAKNLKIVRLELLDEGMSLF
jgi:hypothetical protein